MLAKYGRHVSCPISALAFISVFIDASAARAEGMLHSILDGYRQDCAESSPIFYGIDADLEAAEYVATSEGQAPQLILSDGIIYDLPLGPSGDVATVLYREFYCSNDTRARCGTGGCGFHVIVDDLVFTRRSGFRPGAAVLNGQGVLLIPIHGSGCVNAEGINVSGAEGCHVVATWNPRDRSFHSVGGELRLETE